MVLDTFEIRTYTGKHPKGALVDAEPGRLRRPCAHRNHAEPNKNEGHCEISMLALESVERLYRVESMGQYIFEIRELGD
jgi:hypothetical protein